MVDKAEEAVETFNNAGERITTGEEKRARGSKR